MDKLIKRYGNEIKFSAGIEPYVTLKIGNLKEEKLIEKIKDFLWDKGTELLSQNWDKGTHLILPLCYSKNRDIRGIEVCPHGPKLGQ